LAIERFNEFEKLEAQIRKLSQKYNVPDILNDNIDKSYKVKLVSVRNTLERNWTKNLTNLDKETTNIKKFTTKTKLLSVTGGLGDLFDIGKAVYDTATDTDRTLFEDFSRLTEITGSMLPYASKAAGGPIAAAEISSWIYETTINNYLDLMRALGEERLKLLRDAERQFRDDVKFIIDDEIINSRGKTKTVVESNIRKRIADRAFEFSKRFDYRGGDFYKIVFGNCEKFIFCSEAAMDKTTFGALTNTFSQLQSFVSGFVIPDSPHLIQHLKDRGIPTRIENILAFYNATDELLIKLDNLDKSIRSAQPIKVEIPTLPNLNYNKLKIKEGSFKSDATEIFSGHGDYKNVSFSASTNTEATAVFISIYESNSLERQLTLASANKKDWYSELIGFETAGKRTVIVSAKDKSGKLVTDADTPPIIITVKPRAYVKNVKASSNTVHLGNKVTFTASVSAGLGSGKVMLKLDNYETEMEQSGNVFKKTLDINEAGTNSKRSFTAYVIENGVASAAPTPDYLTVTSPVVISTIKATYGGQPTETFKIGDNILFTATITGADSNDRVMLKLDSFEAPMTQNSPTTWYANIPIHEAPGGKRSYTTYVIKDGTTSAMPPAKELRLAIAGSISTVTALTGGKPTTQFSKGAPIDFIVKLSKPTSGKVVLMLDSFAVPMTKQPDETWKGSTQIWDIPADGKRNYWAFIEEGSTKGPATAKQTLSMASGLLCPAVANTGDLYDAELLVDRRNESIKNAVLHIDACNGKSDDKTITFSESGSGWKWPGIRIADSYCGTFKVSVNSSKNSYTCVTKVNLGSSSPPIVPDSALLSSNGVQYRLSERLISGDVWQISLTIESKPADFSLVKGKFAGSGLLTASGTSAGTVFFTQAGNSWTYQVKGTPGKYSYTPVFKIGTKILDAPARTFTITNTTTNNQTPSHRIPEGSVQCATQPSNTGQVRFDCSLSNSALSSDVAELSLQCSPSFSLNFPRVSSNSYIVNIDFPEGKRTCSVSAQGSNHSISPFTTEITISDIDPRIDCNSNQTENGEIKLSCSLSKQAIANGAKNLKLHCGENITFAMTKTSSNLFNQAFTLQPGSHQCEVSAVENNGRNVRTWIKNFIVTNKNVDFIKQFYKEFAGSYNDKNDSKLRGMISDDWESVGDGTTLADLEMNLRSSFRIFDQVSYTIQNLQISATGSGRFRVTYDALIKGQIYKSRINHEEKSNVSEEVEVDPNGKARITKTLSGRFWYVQ